MVRPKKIRKNYTRTEKFPSQWDKSTIEAFISLRSKYSRVGLPFTITHEQYETALHTSECQYCGTGEITLGVDLIATCALCTKLKSNLAESTFLSHVKRIFRYKF